MYIQFYCTSEIQSQLKKKNFKVDMHKLLHMNAMYKLNEEINSV